MGKLQSMRPISLYLSWRRRFDLWHLALHRHDLGRLALHVSTLGALPFVASTSGAPPLIASTSAASPFVTTTFSVSTCYFDIRRLSSFSALTSDASRPLQSWPPAPLDVRPLLTSGGAVRPPTHRALAPFDLTPLGLRRLLTSSDSESPAPSSPTPSSPVLLSIMPSSKMRLLDGLCIRWILSRRRLIGMYF